MISPDSSDDHWYVIECQGSLFHPAYAGVSLGLLHGSQPDVIVVCHEPGRERVLGHAEYALPTIDETISLSLRLGSRTNPAIRCGGISRLVKDRHRDGEGEVGLEGAQPILDPVVGREVELG